MCAAALVPSTARTGTAAQQPRPAALWDAFPLRVSPTSVFTPPRAEPPFPTLPVSLPPAIVQADDSSRSPWTIAGVLVAVLLAATGGAVLALRGPAARWQRAAAAATSRARRGAGPAYAWSAEQSYLLVVPGRLRSRVVERFGVPPFRGELIFDDELGRGEGAYVVEALGTSPLPNDTRPCAMLRRL